MGRRLPAAAQPESQVSFGKEIGAALFLGICYLCADLLLNKVALGDGWSIFWPLNGITIALLLRQPRRRWAQMLAGIALGTGLGECLDGNPVGYEILERILSVSEVVLAALLLPPFMDLEQWLRTPRLFQRFASALLLGPGVSGLLAALLMRHYGRASFWSGFNFWATADALGIAATMPLVLALFSNEFHSIFRWRSLPRTLGLVGTVFAVTALIFSVGEYPLLFFLYPVLVLVDSQLGFAGTALAIFGTANLSVYLTMHHHGPFASWPSNLIIPRNVALQIYLGFNMVSVLPASVLFAERRWIELELRDALERLSILALVDGLTGVANRRALDERLLLEWNRARRDDTSLALLMVDLDMFKQFNDRYGHQAGDDCLCRVAEALTAAAHRCTDFAGRFGGEEFVLLLPQLTIGQACHLAEGMRESIAALSIEHRASPFGRVTVSIGCAAVCAGQDTSWEDLLEMADRALYRAKQGGRDRVCSALLDATVTG